MEVLPQFHANDMTLLAHIKSFKESLKREQQEMYLLWSLLQPALPPCKPIQPLLPLPKSIPNHMELLDVVWRRGSSESNVIHLSPHPTLKWRDLCARSSFYMWTGGSLSGKSGLLIFVNSYLHAYMFAWSGTNVVYSFPHSGELFSRDRESWAMLWYAESRTWYLRRYSGGICIYSGITASVSYICRLHNLWNDDLTLLSF